MELLSDVHRFYLDLVVCVCDVMCFLVTDEWDTGQGFGDVRGCSLAFSQWFLPSSALPSFGVFVSMVPVSSRSCLPLLASFFSIVPSSYAFLSVAPSLITPFPRKFAYSSLIHHPPKFPPQRPTGHRPSERLDWLERLEGRQNERSDNGME